MYACRDGFTPAACVGLNVTRRSKAAREEDEEMREMCQAAEEDAVDA